jgi:hypothetical protein
MLNDSENVVKWPSNSEYCETDNNIGDIKNCVSDNGCNDSVSYTSNLKD